MTFLVLRSFYEERNPEDLELHGMESQPGMARYGNSQSNLESVILKSTLKKVFTQFIKIDFPIY